ncbi:hypothetical protein AB0M32_42395 [Streptomyces sp. NPDC051985]|uniref:DODA-type extradiol aromatic ring-opening family dioxygenase n=1 Tax=Streptomyces sp. NPDC051985 TaxID=3155807 RepID=UPI0034254D34
MGEIVVGYALSHSSMMVSQPELVTDDSRERCYGAFDLVRRDLLEIRPDCVILVGTDHFNSYFYDLFPQWCVGRASSYQGWADNMPLYTAQGAPELSAHVISSLLDDGFETCFSDEMRLDHSFFGPLHFLTPDMDVPVVPVFQNCITPPYPRLRRSFDLGGALARAVASGPDGLRVAIIGSGGLSHWLGGPEHGRLNPAFDEEFLTRFADEDRDWLTHFTDDDVERLAGNGGHEIRNWLTVRGALPGGRTERHYYEPLHPWFVGAAVAKIFPEGV